VTEVSGNYLLCEKHGNVVRFHTEEVLLQRLNSIVYGVERVTVNVSESFCFCSHQIGRFGLIFRVFGEYNPERKAFKISLFKWENFGCFPL